MCKHLGWGARLALFFCAIFGGEEIFFPPPKKKNIDATCSLKL